MASVYTVKDLVISLVAEGKAFGGFNPPQSDWSGKNLYVDADAIITIGDTSIYMTADEWRRVRQEIDDALQLGDISLN